MRQGLILFLLGVILFSPGCSTPASKSDVTPEVHLNKASVEMGTPVEIEYSFVTDGDFSGFRKNLNVFVHFLDPQGTIRFVDDHLPPVRTNQWMPSQKYQYARTVFVPENIPTGEYTIELGLYLTEGKGEHVELNAKKITSRSYDVGRIKIEEPRESNVQYLEGWYDLERDPAENFYHWRWTKGKAILQAPNPGRDSILYLRAESDQGKFPNPQQVTIRLNDAVIDAFQVPGNEEFVKKYAITRQQLGIGSTVQLELHVDQTFVPAANGDSKDTRELGLRVFDFYLIQTL